MSSPTTFFPVLLRLPEYTPFSSNINFIKSNTPKAIPNTFKTFLKTSLVCILLPFSFYFSCKQNRPDAPRNTVTLLPAHFIASVACCMQNTSEKIISRAYCTRQHVTNSPYHYTNASNLSFTTSVTLDSSFLHISTRTNKKTGQKSFFTRLVCIITPLRLVHTHSHSRSSNNTIIPTLLPPQLYHCL
jgi:hypothetical protein